MRTTARWLLGTLLYAVLFSSGVALIKTGIYGWTVFVVHPVLLGALTAWVFNAETRGKALLCGAVGVLLVSAGLLLLGFEGAGCIVMALPLTLPLGVLGGWAGFRSMASRAGARGGIAMLLILPPAAFTFDTHATPAIYAVTTSLAIDAPPDKVWEQIPDIPEMPEPREWYFRGGLAYPIRARLAGPGGVGTGRTCDFSTGRVVEEIEAWDPPRRLRFRVVENPAPMREWSPYGKIAAKHLHGYFLSREGEFRLTALPGNRTLLAGTSWYQHGLWPAAYWRWWSDAIVHRIHLRVFRQIQAKAEAHAHS